MFDLTPLGAGGWRMISAICCLAWIQFKAYLSLSNTIVPDNSLSYLLTAARLPVLLFLSLPSALAPHLLHSVLVSSLVPARPSRSDIVLELGSSRSMPRTSALSFFATFHRLSTTSPTLCHLICHSYHVYQNARSEVIMMVLFFWLR